MGGNPIGFIDLHGLWAEDAHEFIDGADLLAHEHLDIAPSSLLRAAVADDAHQAISNFENGEHWGAAWTGAGILIKPIKLVDRLGGALAGPIHHICTNKNCISALTGGPWTPRFEALFDRAGMNLDNALNKVVVAGHKGPPAEVYHGAIFRRLEGATGGLSGDAYRDALQNELRTIAAELQTPGSILNNLVTKP